MTRQFNFRIPDKLAISIKQQAELEGRTQTDLIITSIEHYLEKNSTISINQNLPKSSSEFHRLTPAFDPIKGLPHLIEQFSSPDLNSLLLNRLTSSLETQFQEAISVLVKRISVLESHLIHQVEMGNHSGLNSETFRQPSQVRELYPANLESGGHSLETNLKNEYVTVPKNETPLQEPSQVVGVQMASNNTCSLTDLVQSVSTLGGVPKSQASVAFDSLAEQPQYKTADDDGWITPQTAYEFAKTRGYQHSFDAFRLSTTNKKDPAGFFAQFGLSYDPTRRVSRGITSKCFRFIQE